MSISDTVDHVLSELKGLASNYKTQAQNLIPLRTIFLTRRNLTPPRKLTTTSIQHFLRHKFLRLLNELTFQKVLTCRHWMRCNRYWN